MPRTLAVAIREEAARRSIPASRLVRQAISEFLLLEIPTDEREPAPESEPTPVMEEDEADVEADVEDLGRAKVLGWYKDLLARSIRGGNPDTPKLREFVKLSVSVKAENDGIERSVVEKALKGVSS